MLKLAHHVTTVVRSIRRESDRVLVYELADPDDWDLPPFTAGAHINVHLRPGLTRSYSLCGSPAATNRYWIAVQREATGRGGSVMLQDTLEVGSTVSVSLPRNQFPLAAGALHHTLIAGGIGITPMISMIEVLHSQGASFDLHYCTRSPEQTAFRQWLETSPARDHVTLYCDETLDPNPLDLNQLLSRPQPGEHIYCCGPRGLIDAMLRATASRDPSTIHVELFGAGAIAAAGAEVAFTVELARSKSTVEVAVGETILQALRRADVEIDASCEAGVCLSCKTRYLGGTAVHRDLVMSALDRREFMTPCVSGCASTRLVLDL